MASRWGSQDGGEKGSRAWALLHLPNAPVRPGQVSVRKQHHRENRPMEGKVDVSLSALWCWALGGPLQSTAEQDPHPGFAGAPGKATLPHMAKGDTSQHCHQLRVVRQLQAGAGVHL